MMHPYDYTFNPVDELVLSIVEQREAVRDGYLIPLGCEEKMYRFRRVVSEAQFLDLFPRALHYLDRFWLILPRTIREQRLLWSEFYHIYGSQYEKLVNMNRNVACMRFFRQLIEQKSQITPKYKILDYGCGLGFSSEVFEPGEVIGYDNDEDTLIRACTHGLMVVDWVGLNALASETFHDCIACYVFHMAIAEEEVACIANLVKSGGYVVANYYKGLGERRVTRMFCAQGFHSRKVEPVGGRFGSVYIYEKK